MPRSKDDQKARSDVAGRWAHDRFNPNDEDGPDDDGDDFISLVGWGQSSWAGVLAIEVAGRSELWCVFWEGEGVGEWPGV